MKFLSVEDILKLKILDKIPGAEAHQLMAPVNRVIDPNQIPGKENFRESAVALIITEVKGALHSVLIQRPEYDGVHSKQIALPGGKRDLEDFDLEATARRETHEEINLRPERLELINSLSPIYIPVSQFKVQPFVFYAQELDELIPEEREVDEILIYPITELLDSKNIRKQDMIFSNNFKQKDVPYFSIQNKVVWGATAMILSEFRHIIKTL